MDLPWWAVRSSYSCGRGVRAWAWLRWTRWWWAPLPPGVLWAGLDPPPHRPLGRTSSSLYKPLGGCGWGELSVVWTRSLARLWRYFCMWSRAAPSGAGRRVARVQCAPGWPREGPAAAASEIRGLDASIRTVRRGTSFPLLFSFSFSFSLTFNLSSEAEFFLQRAVWQEPSWETPRPHRPEARGAFVWSFVVSVCLVCVSFGFFVYFLFVLFVGESHVSRDWIWFDSLTVFIP